MKRHIQDTKNTEGGRIGGFQPEPQQNKQIILSIASIEIILDSSDCKT